MDPEAPNRMTDHPKPGMLIELSREIEWRTSTGVIDYPDALYFMEQRAGDIHSGHAPETVWLLEHPPLYTAGTSADKKDLLSPDRFPVYATGRGGEYTYHGPGQRVAYVMVDLTKRGNDIRAYVHNLESWVISSSPTLVLPESVARAASVSGYRTALAKRKKLPLSACGSGVG